jgi:restriction system protein
MDGVKFEYYLKELYISLGYSAKVTKSSGDFGADLVLTKDGRKIVVQAKRYSNNVGVKAVQEIKAAQSHYNAIESWVVTNSYFTKAAVELARSNSVKLINRDQLIQDILSIKKVG